MPIFNEEYTLITLSEMKTREEYARRSFKKKYNFKPDKPGSNSGTITVDGEKINIKMGADKTVAHLLDKDSTIDIKDKTFFKLKGSNNSDRRDAMLKHEIGHQKLHNIHPDNKTVDNDKRSINQYRSSVSYLAGKDKDKLSLSMDDIRDMNKYFKNATKDPSKIKERDDSLNAAKKYASDKYPHAKDVEYEADRYSANHSSEGSIKRGIRNTYKVDKQSAKKSGFTITPEKNREIADDIDRRSRALKDKKLKGSKVYK